MSIPEAHRLGAHLVEGLPGWDHASTLDMVVIGYRPHLAELDADEAGSRIVTLLDRIREDPAARRLVDYAASQRDDSETAGFDEPFDLLSSERIDALDDELAGVVVTERLERLEAGLPALEEGWSAADVIWRGHQQLGARADLDPAALLHAGLGAIGRSSTEGLSPSAGILAALANDPGWEPGEAVQLVLHTAVAYLRLPDE